MARIPKYKDLMKMTKEEIIYLYNEKREQYEAGPSYWLDELIRREQREYNQSLRRYTIAIVVMTVIITISTIINIFL